VPSNAVLILDVLERLAGSYFRFVSAVARNLQIQLETSIASPCTTHIEPVRAHAVRYQPNSDSIPPRLQHFVAVAC
jgi:hypothetical protein